MVINHSVAMIDVPTIPLSDSKWKYSVLRLSFANRCSWVRSTAHSSHLSCQTLSERLFDGRKLLKVLVISSNGTNKRDAS